MDYKITSIKPTIERIEAILIENKETESTKNLQSQYAKSDRFRQMAINLGEWKRKNIDKNPKLRTDLKMELEILKDYFSERNVLKFYLNGKGKNRNIALELLGLLFGGIMIVSGIYDEINHNYFYMHDSSIIDIKPGFSTSLYGLILMGCCATLIYTKRFKK